MSHIDFYQFFETLSSTYTYILVDKSSKDAVVIDSVMATVERDLSWIQELELNVVYALETHVHADHITGSGELRRRCAAKYGIGAASGVDCADLLLTDGQVLNFGAQKIKVIATPGHTEACISFYCEGRVFTGDTLLIRGCGRTDFQEGSPQKLFKSVRTKLFSLPDETEVYPAHDYKGRTRSTIGLEKQHNPRLHLGMAEEDFCKIMDNLKLPDPQQMETAVPMNTACGLGDGKATKTEQKSV